MERLRDIAIFIRDLMKMSRFRTEEMDYQYPASSLESSILASIEGIEFMSGSGYIYVAGRDFMEYASSDSNLSIAWDGSRPNVKHTIRDIPNQSKYEADTLNALEQGGDYIEHTWMDKEQLTYVIPYDDYLYIGAVSIPAEVTDVSNVMASFIAQVISRFIVTNIWKTDRYSSFIETIKKIDPRITLHNGYLDRRGNMAHVPYYPMTVSYRND